MNTRILNKDFQHPADGWYQIEALGNHPNKPAGLIQVLDGQAAEAIVKTFNSDAAAGRLRHGNEMLIDHEHFSDQADQESRAYGWLQELQNRDDGIYGRIRWTATGQAAVDGGDYRFFSTEYEPADLKVVNSDDGDSYNSSLRNSSLGNGKPKKVRPLRLAGLTLTNMNNNRGQKPITNRGDHGAASKIGDSYNSSLPTDKITNAMKKLPKNKMCPDCGTNLVQGKDGDSDYECPDCGSHFAGSDETAEDQTKTKNRNTMNKIATQLGLAAEASEDSILAALTKIQNRISEIEPLSEENKTLKNRIAELDAAQVDALLAERGIKEEKVINRLQPVLAPMKNREERLAFLEDCGFKAQADRQVSPTARVLNRGNGNTATAKEDATADEQIIARKIMNRANELKGAAPKRSFDECWKQASQEVNAKN